MKGMSGMRVFLACLSTAAFTNAGYILTHRLSVSGLLGLGLLCAWMASDTAFQ